jgi:hypothetical protein
MPKVRVVTAVLLILVAVVAVERFASLEGLGTPDLRIDPEVLDFGPVPVGALREGVLVATNLGSEPIVVHRVRAGGSFGTSTHPMRLEPGESQPILVSFRADTPGVSEGLLSVERKHGRSVSARLRGSAHRAAEIEVAPLLLAFGEIGIDGTGTGLITIRNRGEEELQVDGIAGARPFRVDSEPVRLAPGSAASVEVRFLPADPGTHHANLLIRSTDPERKVIAVRVEGKAVKRDEAPRPSIEVDPPTLDFGSSSLGTRQKQWLSIRNTGTDALSIVSVTAPDPFGAPNRSRRIEPGGSISWPVSFAPREVGSAFGSLVIHSNDPDVGTLTLSLVGEGSEPESERLPADGILRTARAPQRVEGESEERDPTRRRDALLGGSVSVRPPAGETFDEPVVQPPPVEAAPPEIEEPVLLEEAPVDESVADELDAEAPVVETGGSVTLAGNVYIGTYGSPVGQSDVQTAVFDQASATLMLDDLQLPEVEAAFGESFDFSPASAVGRVSELGDVELVLPLEVHDKWGNPTEVPLTLTTGTSTTILEGGTLIALTGSPLDANGNAILVGATTISGGALNGLPMEIVINVSVD